MGALALLLYLVGRLTVDWFLLGSFIGVLALTELTISIEEMSRRQRYVLAIAGFAFLVLLAQKLAEVVL
jgi:hypothetical protein